MGKKLQFEIRMVAMSLCCVSLLATHGMAQNIAGSIVGYVSDCFGSGCARYGGNGTESRDGSFGRRHGG